MNHPETYRDKEVVVLGLAKSGYAVAKVFHQYGAKVTVNDLKKREDCPEADALEASGISVICGEHPDSLIHPGVALIVKNPGIRYSIPPMVKAAELGIETVTEVEVAYHLTRSPIIGITGSNGKTTTTTWIGKMLGEAGMSPVVAGNIGVPLCEAAGHTDEDQWLVVELSSFQLKGTKDFAPRIACLLNICETHLDYHVSMEDYIESKAKLFDNQTESDTAVINWDDPICRSLAETRVRSRLLPFSLRQTLPYGVYVETENSESGPDGSSWVVYVESSGNKHRIARLEELGLPGLFNAENALAAASAAIAAGAGLEAIRKALIEFRGVEHRLEWVRDLNGISIYNNSKATNPLATIKALEAFMQPVVWIGGGLDRGSDFSGILSQFTRQIKAVVALGETRQKIVNAARETGINQVHSVDTAKNNEGAIAEAVRAAYTFAQPGDVILFSPSCASWDMFASYEERGRMFKESVHNL
ncbi:UDP-N-acetylmuramoyl-L-alanine--D-glutamate ligase [Ferviditalea candida]|uniref:UDP-N-acetylmuramoylalanine--D-glutamate ligase n=1 Tax=Ferviditalea candida TaxID=3108399 RepID=A0ABU5ZDQ0_9BACL|nr:UDP-N-acetylmuramoyl-L-alanine--D-glutamate ligase [Paenibacillaceae bacterium T2]